MNEKELAKIVESVVQTVGQQERGRSVYADVTLDMAKQLIAAVEQRAAQMGVNAVIAVANRGANPVAVHCMDNSSSLVVGGPMTGSLCSKYELITKTSNAIIVLPENHLVVQKKRGNTQISMKRAMASCCQCEMCSDLQTSGKTRTGQVQRESAVG